MNVVVITQVQRSSVHGTEENIFMNYETEMKHLNKQFKNKIRKKERKKEKKK